MTSVTKGLETSAAASARKAKIVCTIGPASGSEAMLRDLMRLGMDVARLNFSHGTHEEHARMIDRLRRVAEKEGRTICILQDLQGPKIRTGRLKYLRRCHQDRRAPDDHPARHCRHGRAALHHLQIAGQRSGAGSRFCFLTA